MSGDGDGDTGDGDGDAGDGDGDPATSGDGDGDDGMNCGEVSIAPEYVPPNVVLVVDASGSMVINSWDHDLDDQTPDVTRWNSLHGVVVTVMDQFGPAMNAGIQRFPSEDACPNATQQSSNCYNADSCITNGMPEVGVALDNGAAIISAIPGANANSLEIVGGTPATRGMNSAVAHLEAQSPDLARYVLLITDGAANCTPGGQTTFDLIEVYDDTLAPTVEAAYMDSNITTFVIGIDIVDEYVGAGVDGSPEANPFVGLNEVALAGGAPKNGGNDAEKFFNSTNQDELLMALGDIFQDITECIIDLNSTEQGPPDPIQIPYVEFTSDGMKIPKVEDCANEDGWTWLEEGVIVTFCGTYCDDFKTGGAVFDGTYGCPPAG
ncbi:Endo-1,4-beta-xylanase A precursor [Enhygromyxa salina]|uniref:Endo-1,4-beta-xylanase A n=2 Tax=Enhygromyxa salina TaxID=215803 RepID=A0A0C2DHY7_9BACT|nr:Endo-1,4-beta-xylanase A precursor [Enhygromyxa salina]